MTESDLTPYQGDMKCYGFFKCTKCTNKWTSKHSWANTSQKCKFCFCEIFPYKQLPMEIGFRKKRGTSSGGGHNSELCAKCKELGGSCTVKVRSKNPRARRQRPQ